MVSNVLCVSPTSAPAPKHQKVHRIIERSKLLEAGMVEGQGRSDAVISRSGRAWTDRLPNAGAAGFGVSVRVKLNHVASENQRVYHSHMYSTNP